jgi:hypothetical protein
LENLFESDEPGNQKAKRPQAEAGSYVSSSAFLNDPAYRCGRATEMRTLAAQANDIETRTIMMRLANEYDKLAARAEKRAVGQRLNSD